MVNQGEKLTDVQGFEFTRMQREFNAIINQACRYFARERELKVKVEDSKKKLKSPWLWGLFILGAIIDWALREPTKWYEFSFEWNFGTLIMFLPLLVYLERTVTGYLIEKQLETNSMRLEDLEYRWMALTRSPLDSFWNMRMMIDENGELSDKYADWSNRCFDVFWEDVTHNPWAEHHLIDQ